MAIPLLIDFININEETLIRHAPPFRHQYDVGSSVTMKRTLYALSKIIRDTFCLLLRIGNFLTSRLPFTQYSKREMGKTVHPSYRLFTKNLHILIPGIRHCHRANKSLVGACSLALVLLLTPIPPWSRTHLRDQSLSIIYVLTILTIFWFDNG